MKETRAEQVQRTDGKSGRGLIHPDRSVAAWGRVGGTDYLDFDDIIHVNMAKPLKIHIKYVHLAGHT